MFDIINFIKKNRTYFEDFVSRSTYHSNAIEGNTLSLAETYAVIFNDNSMTITAQPREIYEAINHKYALNYILNNLDKELNEKTVIDIAKLINKNINEISGYRTGQVIIIGAEHIPPNANMVKQNMMYFIYNYNKTKYNDIFEKLAATHIEFERIHPFSDGNGRTGRILLNFELLKNNYPPIVIPKEEKANYLNYIETQNITGLSLFFKELCFKEDVRLKTFIEIEKQQQMKSQIEDDWDMEM